MTKKILHFGGAHAFLSNFYNAPVTYNNIRYRNAEAAFQAQKDPSRAHEFKDLPPNLAKRLGRRVNMRPDWDSVRIPIMRDIVYNKFSTNSYLAQQLLATGGATIIEGNYWHDNFWGDCSCDRCVRKPNQRGLNHLGKILEEVRAELKANNHRS